MFGLFGNIRKRNDKYLAAATRQTLDARLWPLSYPYNYAFYTTLFSLDPYVRIMLYYEGKKVKMKKSSVKKQTLNPYYNEQFTFIVPPERIELSALKFMVMDYDLIGKADVIGQITVGMGTYGPQLRHWRDMLRNPRKPMAQWHLLRPKSGKGEEE